MFAKILSLPLFRQLAIFVGVGILNTLLSLVAILALSEGMGIHYIIANVVGYACGLLSGFVMHKRMTFRQTGQTDNIRRQFAVFLVIFAMAYLSQLILLMTLVEWMGLHNLPAQIAAWVCYVIVSFAGNKYLTFKSGGI